MAGSRMAFRGFARRLNWASRLDGQISEAKAAAAGRVRSPACCLDFDRSARASANGGLGTVGAARGETPVALRAPSVSPRALRPSSIVIVQTFSAEYRKMPQFTYSIP